MDNALRVTLRFNVRPRAMKKVFLSYAAEDRAIADTVHDDLETLGASVWMDTEQTGGQPWWDSVLKEIRQCDTFCALLSPDSVNSIACASELRYAVSLKRIILPIKVQEVPVDITSTAVRSRHWIDYREKDKKAALHLAKALLAMRKRPTLPRPLPHKPPVPESHLGDKLSTHQDRLDDVESITPEQQALMITELIDLMAKPEFAGQARIMLGKMSERQEITSLHSRQIEEALQPSKWSRRSRRVLVALSVFLFVAVVLWFGLSVILSSLQGIRIIATLVPEYAALSLQSIICVMTAAVVARKVAL
jgi:hypothetical protein